ncbi:hypothetical protein RHSIM_Rhsim06G0152500 [Rhododendron simsii]|uniref:Wound-responsive family protein n=1 Tax=Rhododendron simsii TaxID=118357 RepID=A0A834GTT7_RHOSS|nr:hypothetical protein RHSIM_Rhsim06G0152500 [Rhododendron simsii]
MSSSSRAWIAAASVGAVEALKDQGFCRWNYTMRSVHHHAKASLRSFSQANNLSSPSPAAAASARRVRGGEEAKQSEESLRKKSNKTMSSTSRAWIAAASVGAVEALKDQGFSRWNYTMRSVHHHAKASLRSFSQAKNLSSPAPAAAASASTVRGGEEAKQSEESLRKVMYLSCWGPN